jgi:hypothetical protein
MLTDDEFKAVDSRDTNTVANPMPHVDFVEDDGVDSNDNDRSGDDISSKAFCKLFAEEDSMTSLYILSS